jgi:adenylate kinase family enzyme
MNPVERISVVGNSGSGKTTLARRLADRYGLEHIELDALFHHPDWQPRPEADIRRLVTERLEAATGGWVACGNYSAVRELVWERADTVVWLDVPRRLVMRRVIRRTLRRVLTREELWNGNREPLANLYRWDPNRNIIRWSWMNHAKYANRYGHAMSDQRWEHLTFVRLRSSDDVERWLTTTPP